MEVTLPAAEGTTCTVSGEGRPAIALVLPSASTLSATVGVLTASLPTAPLAVVALALLAAVDDLLSAPPPFDSWRDTRLWLLPLLLLPLPPPST